MQSKQLTLNHQHEKQLLSGQQCNTRNNAGKVVTSMKMAKHLQ
jgi:hypothetical protein